MRKVLRLSFLFLLCSCTNKNILLLEIANTKGLSTSSPVYSNGLLVGEVNDLQLSDRKTILVNIELKKELQKVPNDSKFSIDNDGLLGGKAINIELGSSSSYFHETDTIRLSRLSEFKPIYEPTSSPDIEIDPISVINSINKLDSILIELRRLNENLESQKD